MAKTRRKNGIVAPRARRGPPGAEGACYNTAITRVGGRDDGVSAPARKHGSHAIFESHRTLALAYRRQRRLRPSTYLSSTGGGGNHALPLAQAKITLALALPLCTGPASLFNRL